jgi:hypothetical protein
MKNYLKFGKWGKKLSGELNKIGLGYIWQDPKNSVFRVKAVPLHAMQTLRGRGSIAPTHS